jgi:hypothetical protein
MSAESWNYEGPLLGNGFVNTVIARQWLSSHHMIAAMYTHNNTRTVGNGVFYAVGCSGHVIL